MSLTQRKILMWMLVCDLSVLLLHIIVLLTPLFPSDTIKQWVNVDMEGNIPTWYSSIKLFILSGLCLIYAKRLVEAPLRKIYFVLGFIFLFFSMDESARIHEGLTTILKKLNIYSFFPDSHGTWILLYAAIFVLLTLGLRKNIGPFIREKPGRTLFITGAAIYILGAVGIEILSYYIYAANLQGTPLDTLEILVEEGFELTGQTLLIYSLLLKLRSSPGTPIWPKTS